MPKLSKDFPAQLSLQVTEETRIKLIAIGYLLGSGGEYAAPARNLLHRAIEDFINNLDGRNAREFNEILQTVRLGEETKKLMKENQKSPVT